MRVVLEFTLPEDNDDFRNAREGTELRAALLGIDCYLRTQTKHVEPDERDDIYAIRERFYEELSSRGLSLD